LRGKDVTENQCISYPFCIVVKELTGDESQGC
jgi:hypothetical protein